MQNYSTSPLGIWIAFSSVLHLAVLAKKVTTRGYQTQHHIIPQSTSSHCDNILNLHCADVGRKSNASEEVSEPSCSVVEEECTFARLGRVHLHNKAITPRVQREIVRYVIGTHQILIRQYPKLAKI